MRARNRHRARGLRAERSVCRECGPDNEPAEAVANQVNSWGTRDREHPQWLMRQFGGHGHGIRHERVVGLADDVPEARLDERATQRGPRALSSCGIDMSIQWQAEGA